MKRVVDCLQKYILGHSSCNAMRQLLMRNHHWNEARQNLLFSIVRDCPSYIASSHLPPNRYVSISILNREFHFVGCSAHFHLESLELVHATNSVRH